MIKVHVHWTTLWSRLPFSNLWYGLSVNICTCTETTCDVDGCRKYSTGTCIDMFQNNLVTNYSKTNVGIFCKCHICPELCWKKDTLLFVYIEITLSCNFSSSLFTIGHLNTTFVIIVFESWGKYAYLKLKLSFVLLFCNSIKKNSNQYYSSLQKNLSIQKENKTQFLNCGNKYIFPIFKMIGC